MPAGRPTKYTPELIKKAINYRDNWRALGRQIPSNAGLAVYLEVSRECLYEWARDENKKDFSDILNAIQAKQEEVLMDKGLSGDFNSAIAKLALGKHGYHDKQDVKHDGDVAIKHQGLSRASEILAEFGGSGQEDDAKGDVQV